MSGETSALAEIADFSRNPKPPPLGGGAFTTLFILNIVSYGIYLSIVLIVTLKNPGPGAGLAFSIILTLLFVFALIPVTIINIICILSILRVQRPKGGSKIISYAFIAISIFPIIVISWPYLEEYGGDWVGRIRKVTLSREAAIKLINECRVEAIYFQARDKFSDPDEGSMELKGEKDNPYRYIRQNDFDTLVKVAHSVEKRCGPIHGSVW